MMALKADRKRKNGNKRDFRNAAYFMAWLFALLALVTAVAYVWLLCDDMSAEEEMSDLLVGQMRKSAGDLIAGTVGICLSFSATLFMFVTFREQRRQFECGRRDAAADRFESTYFNMLAMLYNVRESVNHAIAARTEGRMKSLGDFYDGFREYYASNVGRNDLREIEAYLDRGNLNRVEREKAEQVLGALYEEYVGREKCDIGYYYRYVFNAINFDLLVKTGAEPPQK